MLQIIITLLIVSNIVWIIVCTRIIKEILADNKRLFKITENLIAKIYEGK